MLSVAFATYQAAPRMTEDDQLVAEELRRSGVTVRSAVWDGMDVDWSTFDCVVIRSTWDYHLKLGAYEKWVRSFERAGTRLWNPPEAVLENMNKRYLTVLAGKGINVVPTRYIAAAVPKRWDFRRCSRNAPGTRPSSSLPSPPAPLGTWRTSIGSREGRPGEVRGAGSRQDTPRPALHARGRGTRRVVAGLLRREVQPLRPEETCARRLPRPASPRRPCDGRRAGSRRDRPGASDPLGDRTRAASTRGSTASSATGGSS